MARPAILMDLALSDAEDQIQNWTNFTTQPPQNQV